MAASESEVRAAIQGGAERRFNRRDAEVAEHSSFQIVLGGERKINGGF
jgi:hypothetical protein